MKPTWEKDGIQLYLGDCRDVLPHVSGDCFCTDPPYGIGGASGTIGKKRAKSEYDGFDDTKEYVSSVCIPTVSLLIDRGVRGALTPGNRMAVNYPAPSEIGCFWQPAACGIGPWGFCTFQPIFYYGRDPRVGKGQKPSGKRVTERPEKCGHHCPKPVGAWTWLVEKVSLDNETVIDPFMGSGTGGVSCVLLGRKFIGIEINDEYFEIAVERIERALRDNRESLFQEVTQAP